MSTPAGSPFSVPTPPRTLECSIFTLSAGSTIHRIHDKLFTAESFNPGKGNSRFAPFTVRGSLVPTSYAATSLECAVFETIFHDIDPSAPFKSVRWTALEPLQYSVLEVTRDVQLAQLFTPDLMNWGLARTQLIDTPRSEYAQTRQWSGAIHDATQQPEGMVWVSRAFDQERAMLLFGTRVEPGALRPISTVNVTTDSHCLGVVHAQAVRAGILISR